MPASKTQSRLEVALKARGDLKLVAYIMAGHPSKKRSIEVGKRLADAGVAALEIGIPFSDPLADGPVIHSAATAALAAGATTKSVLRVCEALSERLPVVLMVYANVVLAGGEDRFVRRAASAGAAGLIVPDLPHDEADELRADCDSTGLALVPLAAPNTPRERLGEIAGDARGFVYTVSVAGTTGERSELPPELTDTVRRVREAATVPVAVGFGISTADHARQVAEIADGVIVGSRVVRAAGEGGPDAVRALVSELADALSDDRQPV
jgi:tryptophan synthase alpha chain